MLRALVFGTALVLVPIASTEAATYTLQGAGTCIADDDDSASPCTAEMSFVIDPASYGGMAIVPNAVGRLSDAEGQLIEAFWVGWRDDPYTLEDDACTDWCAYAITDAVGELMAMDGHCFNCRPDAEVSHLSWRIFGSMFAWGNWSLQQPEQPPLLSAPIPPSLLMLLSALLIMPARNWLRQADVKMRRSRGRLRGTAGRRKLLTLTNHR